MKKILRAVTAIILALCVVLGLAACGGVKKEEEKPDPNRDQFDGLTLVEVSDDTNVYKFTDGEYYEQYKGSEFKGTYKVESGRLYLSPNGAKYNYVYAIEFDEAGNVTGITQTEGRSFKLPEEK